MTITVYGMPGSFVAKNNIKRRSNYVNLYNPKDVFVNRLEEEKKEAERQAKLAKKEEIKVQKQAKKEELAKKKAERQKEKLSFSEKLANFATGLFGACAPTAVSSSDAAFAQSLEDSSYEIDIERRDEMAQSLREGRYADFRKSEFAQMPLEDVQILFDFDEYAYLNEPEKLMAEDTERVIGKPLHTRKNKSTTLNYLRKSDEIEIKKLFQFMKDEEFGTVFRDAADNILEWADNKGGIEAGFKKTNDIKHNWILDTIRTEVKSAYDSLHAPKTKTEKYLIFPNGEKCEMEAFLNNDN